MKLTFTIQIDTDDKNVIVQQTTPATPVIQAVADCTQEKKEVVNSLKPTEVKPIIEENAQEEKQEEEAKPIKRGRPLGRKNANSKDKLKYKTIKTFNKNAVVGSKDYITLSAVMKKTFSNIVNEDLSYLAKNIKCKTLLVYGNKDKETPLYMAKKYNKLIKNSKLKIYKNCGHFAYIQNSEEFIRDCLIFIKE